MQIEQRKISELKPNANNPRKNEKAVEYVKNSIEEFGFINPIICNKDMTILAGHTRYKSAKKLGLKTVPVIIVDFDEKKAEAFALADNKTGEMAEWDLDKLQDETEALDYDWSKFYPETEDLADNFIDDLLDNEFATPKKDSNTFSSTFVIDLMHQEAVKNYINRKGANALEKFVMELVKNGI